jgi:hypothetical protein
MELAPCKRRNLARPNGKARQKYVFPGGAGTRLSLATFMEPVEASVNGTLRVIAVLLLVWFVLRLLSRRFMAHNGRRPFTDAAADQRSKGDVRIERVDRADKRHGGSGGTITDAEFEEVK